MLYYADGICRTCRASLQRVSCNAQSGSSSHTHSEDEIMYLLHGSLRFGRLVVNAGQSIAIPAGLRYSFRSVDGWSFVNHRRRISQFTGAPQAEPVLETWAVFRDRFGGDRSAPITAKH